MNTTGTQTISDEQLIRDLKEAVTRERHATTQLIALLAEMDARRLYLAEGYSSLFVYCTQCLHLSEHATYGRIGAARAACKFPIVFELLTDGSITLTTICLLAGHLTSANHGELLEAARYRSKREVEQQVAALRPLPLVPSVVRKLPAAKAIVEAAVGGSVRSAATPDANEPTTAERGTPIPPRVPQARTVIAHLRPSATNCKSRSVPKRTTS